ncbi:MAG: FkbM family methyltransferase [Planctomycetota bacterium]|jgi:FkbM family methyltransferase
MVLAVRSDPLAEAHSFLTAQLYGQKTARVSAFGGSFTQKGYARHPKVLRFFFDKIDGFSEPNIVDAGASTGAFVLLAIFHGAASVVAFEPIPGRAEQLRHNIALNGLGQRVHTINTALWKARGVRNLYSHVGGPSLVHKASEKTRVATRKLDEMLLPTDRVDLIRLGVNGAELEALQGARETLERWKPDILLHSRASDVRAFLQDLGVDHLQLVLDDWLWAAWS